ncbi:MAG: ATP-binding cassette domain-containing protein [Myxococcota bacterium]
MTSLAIRNLTKTYPNGVRALDDVSLELGAGMFGLLGPNGAGKSTLMRTLATLQDVDAGSAVLSVDGAPLDLLADKERARRVLGYLPQDFGLSPKARAQDLLGTFAVLEGLVDRAARRQVVDALLHKVNLWDARRQAVGTFSGGMRRRFGIAVALLGNPRLIVVDEPTAGLDPAERARFHHLLAELGEDAVVLLSTHIVDDVLNLCPRMAILHQGRVRLVGSPDEAREGLRGRLFARTVTRAEQEALDPALGVISTRLVAGRLEVRVVADAAPAGFHPVEPSLEDVYFAVTTGRWTP